MAEINENPHVEPVLAVKLTRAIWVLVFAVLWLGYMITSFEDSVETVITERMLEVAEIIDHEMDDTNDNYEASLAFYLAINVVMHIKQHLRINARAVLKSEN